MSRLALHPVLRSLGCSASLESGKQEKVTGAVIHLCGKFLADPVYTDFKRFSLELLVGVRSLSIYTYMCVYCTYIILLNGFGIIL